MTWSEGIEPVEATSSLLTLSSPSSLFLALLSNPVNSPVLPLDWPRADNLGKGKQEEKNQDHLGVVDTAHMWKLGTPSHRVTSRDKATTPACSFHRGWSMTVVCKFSEVVGNCGVLEQELPCSFHPYLCSAC